MKLSVHLFRDDVLSFEGLLQERYLEGDSPYVGLPPSRTLPYECRAFLQSNRKRPPRWLDFLSSHFETSVLDLENVSNAFVLLLKVSGRVFAVTFGYGYNAIDRSKTEPRFGLKVSLNLLAKDQIRTLDTRNTDLVTKQRRTHVNVASPLSEFGLNPNLDWIRYVSGQPIATDFAKNVSGSDSLCINCDCDLERLAGRCQNLLDLYQSDDYKAKFPFYDHLQPLSKIDPLVHFLDHALNQAILQRSTDKIAVAYPELEFTDNDRLHHYRIWQGVHNAELEEVTLTAIYGFLTANPRLEESLDKVHIVGIDDNDDAITRKHSLRDFFVFETEYQGGIYILSLGQWFRANLDYVSYVRAQVVLVPDLTADLHLPPIRLGEKEADYSTRVALEKDWLLMDRHPFQIEGYDKVEVCDLLSRTPHFICIKKMRRSATLSHLFAQGSVSARLMRRHPQYRQSVTTQARGRWTGKACDADWLDKGLFVYAIPTEKGGRLADCMFFFSLVNLLEHVDTIRTAGYDVALCKVEYADPGAA